MLKQRLISGLILAAVAILAVFYLSKDHFALLAGLLLLVGGGWEAGRLAGLRTQWARWIFVATVLVLAYFTHNAYFGNPNLDRVLKTVAALWLLQFIWLIVPGLGARRTLPSMAFKLVMLGLALIGGWMALIWLKHLTPWLVVLLLIIIVAADTCAYAVGRWLGGPRLAPRISPGKTWSGVGGGLLGAALFAPLGAWQLPELAISTPVLMALAMVLAAISVGGDLFFSLLKRQRGIKDCSNLLPGHGGILDRLDSLLAALPFFALLVMQTTGL